MAWQRIQTLLESIPPSFGGAGAEPATRAKVALAAALFLTAAGVSARSWTSARPPVIQPVFDLVASDDVDAVRDAVAEHASALKAVDLDGNSPLHKAAMGGSKEMVAALLSAGADPNARNREGATPLVVALQAKPTTQAPIVVALLSAGAAADVALPDGQRPLHVAASVRSIDPAVVRLLVARANGDLPVRDDSGRTPAEVARAAGNRSFIAALSAPIASTH